jgi:two-component system, cell cycle sensor histidine kinase and response regulator CckA
VVALRSPRILVVDDEPAVRNLIVRALQEVGYEVVAVRNGEAGLDAATSAGVPYDLVITNSYMPSMTGEQLIRHLRELFPGLPILHLDDLSRPIGPNARTVPTLYKPFSIDGLLEAVALTMENRPAQREA